MWRRLYQEGQRQECGIPKSFVTLQGFLFSLFLKWKDGHLLQVTRGGTMDQLTISLFSQWLHLIWETLSNDDRYLSTLGIPKTWDMWHHLYYVSQKNPATKQIMGKWSCPNFEIFPHSSNEDNCAYIKMEEEAPPMLEPPPPTISKREGELSEVSFLNPPCPAPQVQVPVGGLQIINLD